MKKSGHIILTTIFITAISTSGAIAQQASHDSAGHNSGFIPHSGIYPSGSFFSSASHQSNNSTNNIPTTNKPRNGGFGNTLRRIFSGGS